VCLADIRLTVLPGDAYYGVSTLDVDPGGLAQLALCVPDSVQLIQVFVGGIPAPLRQLHDRLWQFGLTSQSLPQRISVLFSGSLPADRSIRTADLPIPEIDAVAVESTLWTIRRASHESAAVVPQSASPITEVNQAVTRYRSLSELTAGAAEGLADNTPAEISRWFATWDDAINAGRAELTRASSRAELQEDVIEEIAGMQKEHESLADRLSTHTIRDDATQTLPVADGLPDTFDAMRLAGATVDRYWLSGKPGATTRVDVTRSDTTELARRITVACCVLMLAVVLIAIVQRRTSFTRAVEWTPAFSVVLGIFWWLFLEPSLFGWIIVAVGLYWGLGYIPTLNWRSRREKTTRLSSREIHEERNHLANGRTVAYDGPPRPPVPS
jgi:hypothetical protein